MAYYIEDRLTSPALGSRRPTINEYFLSSYTLSIYDGCEFGCRYCDGWASRMRPFNETVRIATNLPELVETELADIAPGELIGITALTDPYQLAESSHRLTRQVLQRLAERGQPCLILTKSPSVLEDLVLLKRIHEQSLAVVVFTLLTTDPYLAEKIEDKAPAPALRLDAIAQLKREGIPVGVALVPVTPYVNDTDFILGVTLRAVADAGADFVVWDYLHIPGERHRARINEMLARIGSYPPSYYRDLYGPSTLVANPPALPDARYRADRDREIMARCDSLNLPVRAPHELYAGRLAPRNEAALLLKHSAFRDAVQGRAHSAARGRALADLVYHGQATDEQLRDSPHYAMLRQILAGQTGL
ncbi:MAG TPA: radical SAM protein [Roseiflexaceae bacterium]|nr:radical SAM protein [Roseiflexaceae bacterium]